MTIRPGLEERLAWMADNVYAWYSCGVCINNGWCDRCKQSTLDANGGKLPSTWYTTKRAALEEFIKRRDAASSEHQEGK